jgi:hypothetical protein
MLSRGSSAPGRQESPLARPLVSAVSESGRQQQQQQQSPPEEDEEASGSLCQTGLNIANTLEGMGLLGLPYSVRLAGGYTGAAVVLVCVISAYTAVVIAASLYAAERAAPQWSGDVGHIGVRWVRRRSSYVENARSAFGPAGGYVVLVMQLFTLTSVAAIFLVLVGDSLAGVMPHVVGSAALARLPLQGDTLWIVLAWVCIVPTAWIDSLRKISWLSGVRDAAMDVGSAAAAAAAAAASLLSMQQ